MSNYKKSRKFYYGEGAEFPNRVVANKHAQYEMEAMLKKFNPIDAPRIDDTGASLQVLIPVESEGPAK